MGAAATAVCSEKTFASKNKEEGVFSYCLNTSTISGQNPGLEEYIAIAANAGYDGLELWIRDVKAYLEKGHTLDALKRLIADYGLTVEGAIGFAPWLKGSAGMKQMREEMEMMASIGGKRIAAPASGFNREDTLDFSVAAEKYHELLEIGNELGIQPCLEFWGTSPVLSNLGQALLIAAGANHPSAMILADGYHMFRGCSGFQSLKMLSGNALEIFHMNDYPGNIPREKQNDSDRVFPGDGIAPLKQILTELKSMGGKKVLSLELFNPEYWKQDAEDIARIGLQKMKKLVADIET